MVPPPGRGTSSPVTHREATSPPESSWSQREYVAVTARRLLFQYPGVEGPGISAMKGAVVFWLAVQRCPIGLRLRHRQPVSQGLRQIYNPFHIVRPVIQGDIGNRTHDRLMGLRFLRRHTLSAPGQQAAGQCPLPKRAFAFACNLLFRKTACMKPCRLFWLSSKSESAQIQAAGDVGHALFHGVSRLTARSLTAKPPDPAASPRLPGPRLPA